MRRAASRPGCGWTVAQRRESAIRDATGANRSRAHVEPFAPRREVENVARVIRRAVCAHDHLGEGESAGTGQAGRSSFTFFAQNKLTAVGLNRHLSGTQDAPFCACELRRRRLLRRWGRACLFRSSGQGVCVR